MTTLIYITVAVLIGFFIIVLVSGRTGKRNDLSLSAIRNPAKPEKSKTSGTALRVRFSKSEVSIPEIIYAKNVDNSDRESKQVGLSFTENDNSILDKIKFFKMYDMTTRNASARNVFRSKNPPPDICIFDYQATTGPEDAPVTDTHTTFYFRDGRMSLPGFRLLPEDSDIVRRNDSVLKYRPISFASHPDFSSRFRLVGPDGHEIRVFFSPELCSFFEKQDAVCVEGFQSELLVYLPKKKVVPDDFQKYFNEARTIFALFLNRSAMLMRTSETAGAPSL